MAPGRNPAEEQQTGVPFQEILELVSAGGKRKKASKQPFSLLHKGNFHL
jgi:hypothetical protein